MRKTTNTKSEMRKTTNLTHNLTSSLPMMECQELKEEMAWRT